jgi:glycosyltransferase involved in cell wall biosynthesis
MIKVLHLINGEFFAGAERVQDLLAQRLPEQGFEVTFVCTKPGIFEEKRHSTSKIFNIPMRSRVDLGAAQRIANQVHGQGFRLIHAHTLRSALVGRAVARKLGIPMVFHVHSPTLRETERPFHNWVNALTEDRWILPNARHLIAVSDSLRKYLLDRSVDARRITVIPNGVPIVRDTPAWQAPRDGTWVVGTVALFRPRKGIEVLLRAIRLLLNEGRRVKLRAIGPFETPTYENSVRQLCNELGLNEHVEWAGFTRDVHAQMAAMHTFVLPSLFGEGMPMVVIEAMSMGLPVIASRVEGIPEVLGPDQNAGLLVEPNDPASLGLSLAKLITGEVDSAGLAAAAHRRHAEHYSDRAMARGVAQVYRQYTTQ